MSLTEQFTTRPEVTFAIAGVDALLLQFDQQLDPCMPGFLANIRLTILREHGDVVQEVVPSYASLLVYYEPRLVRTYDLQQLLEAVVNDTPWLCSLWSADAEAPGNLVEVPVFYLPDTSTKDAVNDMAAICLHTGLSREDVIAEHSGIDYQVYALGFAPGFAYLGRVTEVLEMPRLANPRQHVPAGSVGIAEQQTAVYPQASPGGWNILGVSPFQWFNPNLEPMTPVQVGDRIRFKPISEAEYKTLLAEQGGQS